MKNHLPLRLAALAFAVGTVCLSVSNSLHAQVITPTAAWSFDTGTAADLTSSNGLYTFSAVGTAPTFNAGSVSLVNNTELVASSINSTDLPNLGTNATVWVRMKFDTAPVIGGFFFGLTSQTTPADWGQMSMTAWYTGTQIGQYSNTTTGAYGIGGTDVPALDTYITMALVYTSGRDQNGYTSASLSQFETYINGVRVSSGSATGLVMNDLAFALGKLKASGGVASMTFDEVQIFDSSLTAAQIAAIPEPRNLILLLVTFALLVAGRNVILPKRT